MCAHGRFCPGEPHGHSLNGVLSGTMHSQEARVWEWGNCLFGLQLQTAACYLASEKLFFFLNFFFKDEGLSVSIWNRAMVLHGPFMSLQSSEGY